ncbi:hypothetical protein [Pseudoalteromonas peptidolytica]|uniref:hypothetical protein n=1 Tax=Pseudoalteromonas peptidolytica TaxID=61150 RepID=UPI00298D923D|nr:hypothetical protein [Pseudoalteromonas peptidolytica]MDW7551411.1 hypothetical protein [Pseudoalteromonas peptidolytica]
MKYSKSELYSIALDSEVQHLNNTVLEELQTIVSEIPENIHAICFEKRIDQFEDPVDFLVCYYCSPHNLDSVSSYINQKTPNKYALRINEFITNRKHSPAYKLVNLIWFSFDYEEGRYSTAPTFCVSTQHCQFSDFSLLSSFIINASEFLAPEFLNKTKELLPSLECTRINHFSFTFGRKEFRAKLVFKLETLRLPSLLKDLDWKGNLYLLKQLLNTIVQVSDEIQVGLSYSTELSEKIEIELPWITRLDENYLQDSFLNSLRKITEKELSTNLTPWLNLKVQTGYYIKITLTSASEFNIKSYLYSSPYKKRK